MYNSRVGALRVIKTLIMRKHLLIALLIVSFGCSEDNDNQCLELHEQYVKALGFTGGSQAAVDEVNRQYQSDKNRLGCK